MKNVHHNFWRPKPRWHFQISCSWRATVQKPKDTSVLRINKSSKSDSLSQSAFSQPVWGARLVQTPFLRPLTSRLPPPPCVKKASQSDILSSFSVSAPLNFKLAYLIYSSGTKMSQLQRSLVTSCYRVKSRQAWCEDLSPSRSDVEQWMCFVVARRSCHRNCTLHAFWTPAAALVSPLVQVFLHL